MRAHRSIRLLLLAGGAALAWCLVVGRLADGDPMLVVEALVGSAIALWVIQVSRELAAARSVERTLAAAFTPAVIAGIACRLTPMLGTDAVVIGALRPRIYVGFDLVHALSDDEIEAVLHHEDHHRKTHAPLRAAALTGWLRIFGRASLVRRLILNRLADLETMADAEALRRGSTAGSLARALLKGDVPVGLTTAFSYAAEQRIEHLLTQAQGDEPASSRRAPYEWLPIAMFIVVTFGCHIGL